MTHNSYISYAISKWDVSGQSCATRYETFLSRRCGSSSSKHVKHITLSLYRAVLIR